MSKDIQSLINLLDDPDDGIFGQVRNELKTLGSEVIPSLEFHWERNRTNPIFQNRIEELIHEIQLEHIKHELMAWNGQSDPSLAEGISIISRFEYPEVTKEYIDQAVHQLSKEIWLELNDQLTALEKVRIINHFLYDVHGFNGDSDDYHAVVNNFPHLVMKQKAGNPLSLSIIYILIAEKLELPIYGINLPRHFIVAYVDDFFLSNINEVQPILFYINPFSSGGVFGKQELIDFLERINIKYHNSFASPCDNRSIIRRMLNNMIFSYSREGRHDEAAELKEIQSAISE